MKFDAKAIRLVAVVAITINLSGVAQAGGALLGDMNGDGVVNFFDIDRFVEILLQGGGGHAGPVAWYPFDGNARDYGANLNHGTVVGEVTYEAAGDGDNKAALFNGGHIEAPDHDSLDVTGDFTIEMWLDWTDSETHKLVSKHEHGTNSDGSWQLEINWDGTLLFQAFPSGATFIYSDTAVVPADQWTHITFTYDESSDGYAFYVNGDPAGSGEAGLAEAIQNTGRPMWIGGQEGNPSPNPLVGSIDELLIWDQYRTEAQIDSDRASSCRYAFDYPDTIVCDPISVGSEPYGVAIAPDTSYIYVTNVASDNVWKIELCAPAGDPIGVVDGPTGVAITPDGSYAYVSNHYAASVSKIQLPDGPALDPPIEVGTGPMWLAITPDGEYVYVANQNDGTVSVIRTADDTVVETILVDDSVLDAAITPDGSYVYVSTWENNVVWVICTDTNTVCAGPIPVGNYAAGLAVTPDGRYVYVVNRDDNNVSVIRTFDNTVIDEIPVGDGPFKLATTPNGCYVYVTNYNEGTVSVICTSENTVIDTIPVGTWPSGLAITPDGSHVYVANRLDGTVSVIGY